MWGLTVRLPILRLGRADTLKNPDWTRRPAPDEYGPFYAEYVSLVPDGHLLDLLESEGRDFRTRLRSLPPDREHHRYGPEKWTVREVVGHCIDAERVNSLRTLWFARGAPDALPGWEEVDWARVSNADERPLHDLADEWEDVRRATMRLLRSFDAESLDRRGTANGVGFTTRGMAWVGLGHALHHRKVLEERYLK